ncbi:MAG: tetratricopeptide repeat protein [Thermogutta sp.]|nr:tetratricopeptide repeat protein [Thermogutta sp.]
MDWSDAENYILQAIAALEENQPIRALSLTEQVVTGYPDLLIGRLLRADALLRLNRGKEALEEAEYAAKLAPRDLHAQMLLAQAGEAAGRLGRAQQAWEAAVDLSHENPQIVREYARFMTVHRGPKPALEAARHAVELLPRDAAAWTILGQAQLRMKLWAEAEQSLQQALQIDPNDVQAQAAMAVFLHLRGREDSALALTRLLEGRKEAEQVVETIRRDAKKRQLNRILVERGIERLDAGDKPLVSRDAVILLLLIFLACLIAPWLLLALWGIEPDQSLLFLTVLLAAIFALIFSRQWFFRR